MSSTNHYYDQNLLGAAPEATKAQRQEGYNVDLLNRRPLRNGKGTPTVLTPSGDIETAVQHPNEKFATVGASHTPFFQSTKGRIAVIIAVIVIIGVVVGGAVGGVKKSHKKAVVPSRNNSSADGMSTFTAAPSPSIIATSIIATSINTTHLKPGSSTRLSNLTSTSTSPSSSLPIPEGNSSATDLPTTSSSSQVQGKTTPS